VRKQINLHMHLIINHCLATLDFLYHSRRLPRNSLVEASLRFLTPSKPQPPNSETNTENPHARSINPESQLLWLSFFRMEMMYIEKLKARTRVLGFMKTKPLAVR
jgi:hypothetical protein